MTNLYIMKWFYKGYVQYFSATQTYIFFFASVPEVHPVWKTNQVSLKLLS